MMNIVSNILGIMIGGCSIDTLGHKKFMHIAFLFFAAAFTFILVFAPSIDVLLVGQLLMGFPNGNFGVLGPMYAFSVML